MTIKEHKGTLSGNEGAFDVHVYISCNIPGILFSLGMVGLQTEPTAFEIISYYLQFPREGVCQAFRATWEVPVLVNGEEEWASLAWCLYCGLPGKGKVGPERSF